MDPYAFLPMAFWVIYGIFALAILALTLVSNWKIFVKMGVPGWKAIVPYYNLWVLIDTLRKPKSWFWILILGQIFCTVCYGVLLFWLVIFAGDMTADGNTINTLIPLLVICLLMFAVAIVMLVYSVRLYHALSRAFGHDVGFTLGLILLPMIFQLILAFGPDKFQLKE